MDGNVPVPSRTPGPEKRVPSGEVRREETLLGDPVYGRTEATRLNALPSFPGRSTPPPPVLLNLSYSPLLPPHPTPPPSNSSLKKRRTEYKTDGITLVQIRGIALPVVSDVLFLLSQTSPLLM